jgi:sulfide:quinone oxidoreductase
LQPTKLSADLSSSAQIALDDLSSLKTEGYRSILCARPDGEDAGQAPFAAVATAAEREGLASRHVPIVAGRMTDRDVAAFRNAVESLPKPILAYCRSGRRVGDAASATGLVPSDPASTRESPRPGSCSHQIVIVGGGAGGIAVAASMLARAKGLDIAIIEPADVHYYQPGWTMVGAGVFRPEVTARAMAKVMPSAVKWIKAAVVGFQPASNTVFLEDGRAVRYEKLVVAPGLKLDWDGVEGLVEALGRNGVTSNYRYDLAPYTWDLVQKTRGGTALFTQPPMPIKCAGAPQKAMYLSCDAWARAGTLRSTKVEFLNAGPALFGVAAYVPPLMKYVERYGIELSFGHDLVKVDGPARKAWFKRSLPDGGSEIVERGFDMLHAVPPQKAPDFIRSSPLAAESGWVAVDQATLRHVRYPDIYSVGDAMSAPNAKTAAAARKQAPAVAVNLLRDLGVLKQRAGAIYNGYGSCPLTVEKGKIILAEFGYGGARLPSFPKWLIDDLEPSRLAWYLKEQGLPAIYWNAMLKGREPLAKPTPAPVEA